MALTALLVAAFVINLDTTIVNVALPHIAGALRDRGRAPRPRWRQARP